MENFYSEFAAAYARGKMNLDPHCSDEESLGRARAAGLRLHRFKRSSQLPRVRKVLGALHALAPESLLDLGTGRGVFLWPLLDEFPELRVTCVDSLDYRVADLQAVARGGLTRLQAHQAKLEALPFADGEFPVVTMLEVLEHTANPQRALAEVCRVTGQALLLSVPSQPDDNPEHLHLFCAKQLRDWLTKQGLTRVKLDGVLNHLWVLAQR
ncbi:methyltransferase domain-containing protein [bacterium]|nr:methyltransferase domain-containing protein [bacterium]